MTPSWPRSPRQVCDSRTKTLRTSPPTPTMICFQSADDDISPSLHVQMYNTDRAKFEQTAQEWVKKVRSRRERDIGAQCSTFETDEFVLYMPVRSVRCLKLVGHRASNDGVLLLCSLGERRKRRWHACHGPRLAPRLVCNHSRTLWNPDSLEHNICLLHFQSACEPHTPVSMDQR